MAARSPRDLPKVSAMQPSIEKSQEIIALAKSYENTPWCEQYERMISGMLYDSTVPELEEGRLRSNKLIKKYCDYLPDDATPTSLGAEREKILRQLVGKCGQSPWIEAPFFMDYGCNISLGDRFYANTNMVILDCGLVTIGDRVMFGPFVSIYAATHETEVQSRRDNIEFAREVTIGDDCWIGGNVVILLGVVIGKGCTIGAGSVVTKSVPDYSVAIGSPAKVVKKVEPLDEKVE
ncbi:putative acetyltransferase [Lachnellula occidentalis]|uniref:Putative acetyltransferase n=1 Tax=Lachnellula occidentalis TaxID=215460 RepID=A0A8H8U2Y3_9HELO|nr:putative acetyltransferase [Lachnellula occidentalis]